MFAVPLSGDKIQTRGGADFVVLSYTNYKDKPSVYVDDSSTPVKYVQFDQITSINGTTVKVNNGVLVSNGRIKRSTHLPQKDQIAVFGKLSLKVQNLKLAVRGRLASGMLIVGTDDAGKSAVIRAAELTNIRAHNKSTLFDRDKFQEIYKDYLGALE